MQQRPKLSKQNRRTRPLNQTPPPAPISRLSPINELDILPTTEAPKAAAKPVELLGKPMTPADWRRFIVAREVLDPPLALRQNQGGFPQ